MYVPKEVAERHALTMGEAVRIYDPDGFKAYYTQYGESIPIQVASVGNWQTLLAFAQKVLQVAKDPHVRAIVADILSAVRTGLASRQKAIIDEVSRHPRHLELTKGPDASKRELPTSPATHVALRDEIRFTMGVLGLDAAGIIRFLVNIRTIGTDEIAAMAVDL